jgi:hypothetical protein
MQGMPSEMQGMPSEMQGMPSDMQGMPSDMQGMPSEMQGMPSDMQGMPSEFDMQQGTNMQQRMPSDYDFQPSDFPMQQGSNQNEMPPSDYGMPTRPSAENKEAPSLFDRLLGRSKETVPDDQDDPAAFLSRFKRSSQPPETLAPINATSDRTDDLISSLSRFKSESPSTLDADKFVSSAYEKGDKEKEVDEASSPQSAVGKAGIYAFFTGFFSWKWALVILALSILYWYIRPYILSVNAMLKGVNDLLDTSAEVVADEEEEPPPKKEKKKKSGPPPEPDETTSNVQGGSQSGFCLAGEWKGVRSCVKLRKGQECVSGQLFPTQETCTNPTLRV